MAGEALGCLTCRRRRDRVRALAGFLVPSRRALLQVFPGLPTALAPLASTAASYGIPAAGFGVLIGMPVLVDIGILSFVAAFLFQLITLPVEFNASRRAMAELDRLQLLNDEERAGVSSMLRAAAMTYVASAAPAAFYLVYFVIRIFSRFLGKAPPLLPPRLP